VAAWGGFFSKRGVPFLPPLGRYGDWLTRVQPFKKHLVYLGDSFPLQVSADKFADVLACVAVGLAFELLFQFGAEGNGERDVHGRSFLLHTLMMGEMAEFVKCWQESDNSRTRKKPPCGLVAGRAGEPRVNSGVGDVGVP